jgi:DNA-binding FadR family transcriptional regulator
MPLQTIEPQRLYRQIAEQVRGLISAGEFAPAERLPAERDLAKQLGVSRPTVREALIALEVEGWVEVRTGSGVYVLDRGHRRDSPTTVEWGPFELLGARRAVEGEIASMAATLAKRRDIAAIQLALTQMQTEANAGLMPILGDRAFHTAIGHASRNMVLTETIQRFWDARSGPVFERLVGHFETLKSWQSAIDEHQLIVEAISAHDAPAARAAMHAHLDKAYARFSASWRRAKTT